MTLDDMERAIAEGAASPASAQEVIAVDTNVLVRVVVRDDEDQFQ